MGLLRSWRFSTVCKTVGYAFIGPNPIKPTKIASDAVRERGILNSGRV